MKKHMAIAAAAATLISFAAAGTTSMWDGAYTGFSAKYLIYSGDLGEQQAPVRSDQKISFAVEGALAKKLFESIGPDQKHACGTESGLRVRHKGDVDCTFNKARPAAPYTCHFGLDLRIGKSIGGSIC